MLKKLYKSITNLLYKADIFLIYFIWQGTMHGIVSADGGEYGSWLRQEWSTRDKHGVYDEHESLQEQPEKSRLREISCSKMLGQ